MATQSNAGHNSNPAFQANLRRLIETEHVDIEELAAYVGITARSINGYCWGTRTPKWQQTQKIAEYLGVTTADLLGISSDARLSHKAYQLATVYDKLDEFGRSLLECIAAHEMERVKTEQEMEKARTDITELPTRKLKLYLTPAAAGPGNSLTDEEAFEEIDYPEDAPQDADFAIRISGESMEPFIKDGAIAYIKKVTEGYVKEIKEVGVWLYEGEVRIKQWCRDYIGDIHLLSANPKRVAANVKIPRARTEELQCLGRVILDKDLPSPDYD